MSTYGILKGVYVVLLVSLIQIMQDAGRIEKAQVEHVTFLEKLEFLSHVKSKKVWISTLQNQNILSSVVIVLRFFS